MEGRRIMMIPHCVCLPPPPFMFIFFYFFFCLAQRLSCWFNECYCMTSRSSSSEEMEWQVAGRGGRGDDDNDGVFVYKGSLQSLYSVSSFFIHEFYLALIHQDFACKSDHCLFLTLGFYRKPKSLFFHHPIVFSRYP